jgi:carboxyl-terminal processing protease
MLVANAQPICSAAQTLAGQIRATHIQPRPLDDKFSAAVSIEFFKKLDPDQVLFTQTDIPSVGRLILEDANDNNACAMVDASVKLYRERALRHKDLVDSILARPFDYTIHIPQEFKLIDYLISRKK